MSNDVEHKRPAARFNRAELDHLVNSNAELVFILHLHRNSIRLDCPFRSNLIRVFKTPASNLDVRRDLALKLSTRDL